MRTGNRLRAVLTTRTAALTAAVALLGGGAAIASPGGGPGDGEVVALFATGGADLGSASEKQDPSSSLESTTTPDPVTGTQPTPQQQVTEQQDDDEDERSETARRVHAALSGDPDIRPGHPDFGCAVSSRARSGRSGETVSRAARGLDAPASSADLATDLDCARDGDDDGPQARGRPAHVPGPPAHANRGNAPGTADGPEAGDTGDDTVSPRSSGRPDKPGNRPAHAGTGGTGGPDDAEGDATDTDTENVEVD